MRVLLSTYGSRGDVEPLAGLAVRLRALGAEVRVCVPPDEDFAELLARVGLPLVPAGSSVRAMVTEVVTGTAPRPAGDLSRRAAGVLAAQFDAAAAGAEGCDAVVATGLTPAAAAARSVTEILGIRYVYACYQPVALPSPHYPPQPWPGHPLPPEVTDNRALWDLNAQSMNAIFGAAINSHRASIDLPPVDNVREHVFTGRPWLAADPVLSPWQEPAELDVVQTGAWILPDERPLPDELAAFLDAGPPPVYVGFGSMPMRASADVARAAIEAIRAQGRRALVARGWAGLALTDGRDDCFTVGEVNQQALFGRVAELGIGAAHDVQAPTTGSLSAALSTALTPQTRARAAAVAGTIRTDGATVAATLLLDAVSRERPPVPA